MSLQFLTPVKPHALYMRRARAARKELALRAYLPKRFKVLSVEEVAFEAGLPLSPPSSLAWINSPYMRHVSADLSRKGHIPGGTTWHAAPLVMTAGGK